MARNSRECTVAAGCGEICFVLLRIQMERHAAVLQTVDVFLGDGHSFGTPLRSRNRLDIFSQPYTRDDPERAGDA